MKFLTQLIVSALAVIVTSFLLPGVHLEGVLTAILVAAVLAFLNAIIKPILIFLTIPITLVTFGFFLLVINAVMILITAKLVGHGFRVDSFWWALLFSLLLSLVNALFESLARKKES